MFFLFGSEFSCIKHNYICTQQKKLLLKCISCFGLEIEKDKLYCSGTINNNNNNSSNGPFSNNINLIKVFNNNNNSSPPPSSGSPTGAPSPTHRAAGAASPLLRCTAPPSTPSTGSPAPLDFSLQGGLAPLPTPQENIYETAAKVC